MFDPDMYTEMQKARGVDFLLRSEVSPEVVTQITGFNKQSLPWLQKVLDLPRWIHESIDDPNTTLTITHVIKILKAVPSCPYIDWESWCRRVDKNKMTCSEIDSVMKEKIRKYRIRRKDRKNRGGSGKNGATTFEIPPDVDRKYKEVPQIITDLFRLSNVPFDHRSILAEFSLSDELNPPKNAEAQEEPSEKAQEEPSEKAQEEPEIEEENLDELLRKGAPILNQMRETIELPEGIKVKYQTTLDGSIFDSRIEAEFHLDSLKLKYELFNWVLERVKTPAISVSGNDNRIWTMVSAEELADLLLYSKSELDQLLP